VIPDPDRYGDTLRRGAVVGADSSARSSRAGSAIRHRSRSSSRRSRSPPAPPTSSATERRASTSSSSSPVRRRTSPAWPRGSRTWRASGSSRPRRST